MAVKKRKAARSRELSIAAYEGMCSCFTDAVGMKSRLPSPLWEKHVVSQTISMLRFSRPDLLEEIKKEIRKKYEENGKRLPEHVDDENGKTVRCVSCGKTR